MALSYRIYPTKTGLWTLTPKEEVERHSLLLEPANLHNYLCISQPSWYKRTKDSFVPTGKGGTARFSVCLEDGSECTWGFDAKKRFSCELGRLTYIALGGGDGPDLHLRMDGEILPFQIENYIEDRQEEFDILVPSHIAQLKHRVILEDAFLAWANSQ